MTLRIHRDQRTVYPGTECTTIRTMDDAARRQELTAFLRTKREGLRPEDVGLVPGSRRRTPGLRREEVAAAAGIGVTWYTWLEQGRDISPSRDALRRIARALRMSATDEAYLLSLGGIEPATSEEASADVVDAHLQSVLDESRAFPAILLGPFFDVLAFNRLADAVFDLANPRGEFGNNHMWKLFMAPERRALYVDFEQVAARTVGAARVRHGRHSGHPRFDALLKCLREGSSDFLRLWDATRTAPLEPWILRLRHARHGRLNLGLVTLLLPMVTDAMVLMYPADDSETAAVFRHLARGSKPQSLPTRAGARRGRRRLGVERAQVSRKTR
jgi:transcriptional regulator with XRE-family HTH domain